MYAIGIDIGGTKIAGGVVSDDGVVSDIIRRPSPASSAAEMEDAIVDIAMTLLDGRDVSGVGIAAAGFIDAEGSLVYYAPIFPGGLSRCEKSLSNESAQMFSSRMTRTQPAGRNTSSVRAETSRMSPC
jgi:predicted NBD/HSP70 family sugar kinase